MTAKTYQFCLENWNCVQLTLYCVRVFWPNWLIFNTNLREAAFNLSTKTQASAFIYAIKNTLEDRQGLINPEFHADQAEINFILLALWQNAYTSILSKWVQKRKKSR